MRAESVEMKQLQQAPPSEEPVSSLVGPWPRVETYAELDAAEWLHTNGAGAYAMSTVSMMHTRRYHGLLVAPLLPPLRRFVLLNHLELTLHAQGRHFRLSTHQFPNLAPTPGYRLLRSFALDPIPHWTYRIGDEEFERTLSYARRREVTVLTFTWRGKEPATLVVRPLLSLRSIHGLMHEHGAMVQRVALRQREVEIQPLLDLPPLCFRHSGMFVGSPDWWRRFEYLEDRTRAGEFQEDLWTPGAFEVQLLPDRPQYLMVAVGSLPTESAKTLLDETVAELTALDPGPTRALSVRRLLIAAECYRVESPTRCSIIAGYPWYGIHLRETLQSLAGIALVSGKLDFARRTLATALSTQRGGLLTDMLTEVEANRGQPSPDSTLWLFDAARSYIAAVGSKDPFVVQRLYPALRRAFVRLRSRRGRLGWISPEGLLANFAQDRPLTWMDGKVGDWVVTPRRGLAIEMQALWVVGCQLIARLARQQGELSLMACATEADNKARASFKQRFWCHESDHPYDCVSERPPGDGGWTDAAVRPNALMALALAPELFEDWQATAIVTRARQELLTPRGLRTLSPNDSRYQGYHEGGLEQREGSAHQGTVWPHLLGYFVRASRRLAPDDLALRQELIELVEGAAEESLALLHVAEMADGDAPHRPRACPAQSTAVAQLLSVLVDELGL